jgi:hypothetical protein
MTKRAAVATRMIFSPAKHMLYRGEMDAAFDGADLRYCDAIEVAGAPRAGSIVFLGTDEDGVRATFPDIGGFLLWAEGRQGVTVDCVRVG